MSGDDEDQQLRVAALENARAILIARQRADEELRRTKVALEEESRALAILNGIGMQLASVPDLRALVQAVTDAGTQVSGAEVGAFFVAARNADGGDFLMHAVSGSPADAFAEFTQPRSAPLIAPNFEGKRVIRTGNVRTDPHDVRWTPHFGVPTAQVPVTSYMAVPVCLRSGEVIGALYFGHTDPDVFTERSERLVIGIAAHAAVAIDNIRLYDDARRSADAERAARSEVERVSLMKDEFLATLSHELRTPLNAVLGWSEILLRRAGADTDLRRGLETIARNARSQAQMIEDLLDMNRIVSGKIRIDVQRVSLVAVVEAALDSIRPSAEAKSIRLLTTLDPNAGLIHGDPHRLQQVIWNLLSNAVKFTPKHGRVDVLLRSVNSHVELTVSDSGVGIKPDFLPQIFERFRQADSSTTRRYSGLGLGLSIVKQLVELHGGSVRADSAGENAGSTFIVTLPVRAIRDDDDQHHPRTGRTPTLPRPVDLTGLEILVVDDEPDARELVMSVLTEAGASVRMAHCADAALDAIAHARPHVIISDIGMPERDGYELMRMIRELPEEAGGRTPAIALTAFARSEDRTRALFAGFQVHVAKPIEPHELLVTVASLMGRMGTKPSAK